MKDGFLYRVSLAVVPTLFVWLTRVLFTTCRVRTHGLAYRQQAEDMGGIIGACWHYAIMFNFYYMRRDTYVAMVSASRDGEYINRVALKMGLSTIRGSQGRKGVIALKKMIRQVGEGSWAAIVADGSKGPARIVQPGSIMVASRTGKPILPMLWSANRYKSFGSWDRTVIPMPFSRIDFFYGEPLAVPDKLDAGGIEEYRLKLEKRLNALYDEAWGLQGKEEH